MAAEGGGSKIGSSTQNDERLEKPSENQKPDAAETVECQTTIGTNLHKASAVADSSNADPEESETKLCGWLSKCGNIGFVKTNKQLWFVFSDDTYKLYFYRNPQDLLPLGEIDIKHASFYPDASNHRPGLFEIRSEGKVYYLDAHRQHIMTYWLEALQKKRRLYSLHRKKISSEKLSWTLKNRKKGSGLTGQGKDQPLQLIDDEHDQTQGSVHSDDFDAVPSTQDLESMSPDSKPQYWSLLNLRSDIRDAVSNIRIQILPTSKMSPPASPSAEGKEEWTILDNNNDPVSPPPVPTSPTSQQATSPPAPTNSGTKLGGKISNTFNFRMFKPGKRSQNDSGSVPSRDQGSRKVIHQSGTQTCYKCKVLQEDLLSMREDLRTTEEELEANREITRLLQKELEVMRVAMETRKESEGKSDEEKDVMLQQKDKHVVELEHSLAVLQEEKSLIAQQARLNEGELAALQEQVAMLQDMLSAKDETVVQLTNQIFELESSGTSEKGDGQEQNVLPAVSTPALLMADAKEMEALRDSVRAYQLQNNFLSKEIMELHELRKMDEKREKELLIWKRKVN